jgi:hypothetical protein
MSASGKTNGGKYENAEKIGDRRGGGPLPLWVGGFA